MSVYLNASDCHQAPTGWTRHAAYRFTVVNHMDPALSVSKGQQPLECYSTTAYSTYCYRLFPANSRYPSQIYGRVAVLHAESSSEQTFHQRSGNWGFMTFMPLEDVLDETKGFLKDGKLKVRAVCC